MLRKHMHKLGFGRKPRADVLEDVGALTVVISAVTALVLVALFAALRIASERAYREKWKDYNDCGWA